MASLEDLTNDRLAFEKSVLNNSSTEDWQASYTIKGLKNIFSLLNFVKQNEPSPTGILDLGCGYGGLTKTVGQFLSCKNLYGIEIDPERIPIAKERGIKIISVDLGSKNWPIDSNSVDLITSFGVLEHVPLWDNLLEECRRIARKDALLLISIPNMASYIQRFSLLLGHQPRDVEVSDRFLTGVLPIYSIFEPAHHLHTLTLRALTDLLLDYGFKTEKVKSIRVPIGLFLQEKHILSTLFEGVDWLFSLRPSFARRFAILARKQT
jgi:SAM-dependent methyltransferase